MPQPKTSQNYEELKQQLDEVLFKLQREDIGVDEALNLYESGQQLLRAIQKHLKSAEHKVTELKLKYKDD